MKMRKMMNINPVLTIFGILGIVWAIIVWGEFNGK